MTYCTQCGAPVKEGAKFCSACGQAVECPEPVPPKVQAVPAAPAAPAAPPPRPAKPPAFPPSLAGVVEPLPGERTVRLWRCRYLNYGPRELSEGRAGLRSSNKGLLIATTHRLIYLQERGALRTAGYEVTENLPWGSVRGVEVRGDEVQVPLKEPDALTPRFIDASAVEPERLRSQQNLRADDLGADLQGLFNWWCSQRAGGGEPALDYAVLRSQLDRAGLSVSSVRCAQCGADIPLPTWGNAARCSRCGATVFPQDIVKRMQAVVNGKCREP